MMLSYACQDFYASPFLQPNTPQGAIMPADDGIEDEGQGDEETGGVRMVTDNKPAVSSCMP